MLPVKFPHRIGERNETVSIPPPAYGKARFRMSSMILPPASVLATISEDNPATLGWQRVGTSDTEVGPSGKARSAGQWDTMTVVRAFPSKTGSHLIVVRLNRTTGKAEQRMLRIDTIRSFKFVNA